MRDMKALYNFENWNFRHHQYMGAATQRPTLDFFSSGSLDIPPGSADAPSRSVNIRSGSVDIRSGSLDIPSDAGSVRSSSLVAPSASQTYVTMKAR